MRGVFRLVLILTLALMSTSVFAQTTTTGSIEGMVSDPNGAAVPGARVTVTSPNLISPQKTTTGGNGRYSILALPPGKYNVTVEAPGFAKYELDGIFVNLGRTASGDVSLQVAGATAIVTVKGAAGIDLTQNTSGAHVSTEQFSNFVMTRSVGGLYMIAPTVTRSGLRDATGRDRDPSVAGASGPENNYILDGVNTTDPAFGGAGANLPFEFIQEVEIKTGAYGPEYGRATGGIFNVITKSGGNEFHGDVFAYGTAKGMVRGLNNFPFTGSSITGFSEVDAGGDIGGPIVKDKIWFFGAFNPQTRKNYYLTQTFHVPVDNKVTIPFYAFKITWAISGRNTFTLSTFGDFSKVEGFLATNALNNVNGFGDDITSYLGRQETGGSNYAFRLNSTITNNFIGEFSGGLHFQRANTIPRNFTNALVTDNFVVLRHNAVLVPVQSGFYFGGGTGFIDYVDGRGGSLERYYTRGSGFGLYSNQDRNRYEFNTHMQNILGRHTIKWGFEWSKNQYDINTRSSGPDVTYPFTPGLGLKPTNGADANQTNGSRITNNYLVCTVRGTVINCPSAPGVSRARAIPAAHLAAMGLTVNPVANPITTIEALNVPFLIRNTTRVRDFRLVGDTTTNVESLYVGDDWKFARNWQASFGGRWDYQQGYANGGASYITFNDFWDNFAPRLGLIWDFTGKGKGKFLVNYAKFIEVPLPLDLNVRAAGGDVQTDKNMNVNTLNAPVGSLIVPGVSTGAVNLGSDASPIDPGLLPQSTREFTGGFEYEVGEDVVLGARGVYRAMINVIEDGSFDDGNTYFLFNPGRNKPGTTEAAACAGDPATGRAPNCFGRAQRFYRALELTATKRFTDNYQFIVSYVYSSLTGNYEGLFRNDNGQSDPNITSLFDLQSLLNNTYGRLPNDRPHQFKFNGSYRTPWKLIISGKFNAQSGVPFNQLIPHPVYGNNEGFEVQRGTAVIPVVTAIEPGFPNFVNRTGSIRTPSLYNVDLGFNYPIKLGEKMDLQLSAAWFNVLNMQRAVTLDQMFSENSGVFGVPAVVNPFWGSAVLVQPPSSWRFGAKFRF